MPSFVVLLFQGLRAALCSRAGLLVKEDEHLTHKRIMKQKTHFGLIGRLEIPSAPRVLKGLRVVPDLVVFVVSFASSNRPRIDSAATNNGIECLFVLGCYRTLECPVEWRTDACPTSSTALGLPAARMI